MVSAFQADEVGSILVETCLGVIAILLVVLPSTAVVRYLGHTTRDTAAVQQLAREVARTGDASAREGFVLTCGASPTDTAGPCSPTVVRKTYVRVAKSTAVTVSMGVVLHTNAAAVARAE